MAGGGVGVGGGEGTGLVFEGARGVVGAADCVEGAAGAVEAVGSGHVVAVVQEEQTVGEVECGLGGGRVLAFQGLNGFRDELVGGLAVAGGQCCLHGNGQYHGGNAPGEGAAHEFQGGKDDGPGFLRLSAG